MEKEVKMEVSKGGNQEVRKMSQEEVENIAHQLSEQNRQLYVQNQKLTQALQEANLVNYFKRLDYLWQITTIPNNYLTEEFKIKCGIEFAELMTQPEVEAEDCPSGTQCSCKKEEGE